MDGRSGFSSNKSRIKWLRLSLENINAISIQIDEVVTRYRQLHLNEKRCPTYNTEILDQYKESIQQRVIELQQFYLDNDLDERAILFEKQRLKLKKLLSAPEPTSRVATQPTVRVVSSPSFKAEISTPAPNKQRPSSGTSSASNAAKPAWKPGARYPKTPELQPVSGRKSSAKKVKAIYEWEKPRGTPRASASADIVSSNNAEESKAADAHKRMAIEGVVKQEDSGVTLTPQEYQELQERRKAAEAALANNRVSSPSAARHDSVDDEDTPLRKLQFF